VIAYSLGFDGDERFAKVPYLLNFILGRG